MATISVILPGFALRAGGGYKIVYQYANHLAKAGNTVNLVQMRPDEARRHREMVWRHALRFVQYTLGRHARPRWFSLDRRVNVVNFARQSVGGIPPSDVIVATATETAQVVARAAALQSVPGVYFIQHYEAWRGGSSRVDDTWRLPLHRIVVGPWLESKAIELGVTAVQVPNAIDGADFPPGPPIGLRPLRVLALVSDIPWKRTDLVVEVFGLIAAEMPEVSFATFGVIPKPVDLPAYVHHLQEPSSELLRVLYQQSRVFVCASDAEGWGLPPAEAMSSGSAVVSTDNGGVRGYADGVALFSPVGDAASLAANALRLLRDEELCARMASEGQERLRAYTPAMAAEAFEREVLSTLNGA
ncbi:glycosyltransferase involved in cell wall biosynthesis [Cryobacterium sp. MP_M5]|uniref:glycosyltransferase family 4 protein n=1 Tax=unclassified Cryobacterium TaxID=2649013 RepID=UPI0018C90B28|nr:MULTISPECIES: glycosyltransferase family 4 protein [unclassified Cryobacterium]MBG6056999.1 glycosyltransferase involved in cell wall biosynthesis [Cryobacterium sp. MP_M3]MEC5175198.1 glycosyltransferase involved in cell wall biosynthesis [Cryobacterium sp. MP_M5]